MRIEDKILVAVYLLSNKQRKPVELIKLKAFLYLLEKEAAEIERDDIGF